MIKELKINVLSTSLLNVKSKNQFRYGWTLFFRF